VTAADSGLDRHSSRRGSVIAARRMEVRTPPPRRRCDRSHLQPRFSRAAAL